MELTKTRTEVKNMLYTYSIEKLTGLQGLIINNIESNEKEEQLQNMV